MKKRDWTTLVLYGLGMASLFAGLATGVEAFIMIAVGLVVGAVLVPLLDGPDMHLHVNLYETGKAAEMTKTKKQLRAERNPFYTIADRLGVNCADRTDEVIAAEMLQQLSSGWMELPIDGNGQPVRWDESVYIDDCGADVFAKVFGICAHNRIAVYIPGEILEHRYQSLNARYVREVDYVEN